ncbi:HXXEE domain-containing protein [Martelella sp. AD-3]|uniref:HXXEE domain-containing protein n=1 Tax=Martelella sp. AD-3 TaxID=686597 RepID=UPI000467A3B1|nr:HXXEE domain-containing protein [Martelella sp. AD-3]AMM84295.1 hypothetical protein AZF01_07910 [Martelella sp. AD-3]
MAENRAFIFLAMAFAMLWLPLGQHGFLLTGWMKLGTFMAPFLLFFAFAFSDRPLRFSDDDIGLYALILWIAYIIHQFEEHWVDLFGQVYAFKPYVNMVLLDLMRAPAGTPPPLTDAGVFVINTSLVWLVAALAILSARHHLFPALCMVSIVLVNAVSHVGMAIIQGGYNPGLLTAIVLFFPLSLAVYHRLLKAGIASRREVAASIFWGVIAHIIMFAGLLATGYFQLIPEIVYFALLVIWSVVPCLVLRNGPPGAIAKPVGG